jgi:hypothetical protein
MKFLLVLCCLTTLTLAIVPAADPVAKTGPVPYDFGGIELRETNPLHDGLDYLMEQKREAIEEQVKAARKAAAKRRKKEAAERRKKEATERRQRELERERRLLVVPVNGDEKDSFIE